MFLLQKGLKHIKLQLKEWNKKGYGNIFVEKEIVEGKMYKLNQALITKGFDKEQNELATKYHQDWENLCKQEEIFWRQKSRVQWLRKETATPDSSREPLWRTELTTRFLLLRTRKVTCSARMKKLKLN